jgi:hypothetical protein
MFALSFTSLALVRIQQAKEFKQERRSANKAPKKPLVPDIARRGIAAVAVLLAFAASSAYARGPLGGPSAAGARFPRKPTSFGSNSNVQPSNFVEPIKPIQQVHADQPVLPIQHFDTVKPVQHVEPFHQLDSAHDANLTDKLDGAGGVSHHVDSINRPDNARIVDSAKPRELSKNLFEGKTLNRDLNLKLNKNLDLGKNATKPSGNAGVVARGLANGSKRSVNG